MFEQMTPHLLEEHEYLVDSPRRQAPRAWRAHPLPRRRRGTQLVTFGDGDVEPAFA